MNDIRVGTDLSQRAESVVDRGVGHGRAALGWSLATWLALATGFWVLVSFGESVMSAVSIWLRSDTYAHGLLVVPIAAFLVWRERETLPHLPIKPNVWGLIAFSAAGGLWLLGRVADVDAAQQFAVVLMLVAGTWALLGNAVVRQLWFPLMFLVFAVPVGDFLLPPLMDYTADFTVATLRLTGIPVYREGHLFTIPSGRWSVVEACSGLRYLIASLTLGTLYAYLSYRSLWKRLGFVLLSILVPILANGLRAYMIVMIGHLSSMKLAVGADHLIYGWVFFGLVMMLMFWIGSLWRDNPAETSAPAATVHQPYPVAATRAPAPALLLMALALAGVAAFWPAYAQRLTERYIKATPHLSTPRPVAQWRLLAEADMPWKPAFLHARTELTKTYVDEKRQISLHIKYYRNQRQGREMVNADNILAFGRSTWNVSETRSVAVPLGGRQSDILEAQLSGAGTRLLLWHWFAINERSTVDRPWAKLLQAKSRIVDGHDDAAAVFLVTPIAEDPTRAAAALSDFAAQMWPSIDESLHRAKP